MGHHVGLREDLDCQNVRSEQKQKLKRRRARGQRLMLGVRGKKGGAENAEGLSQAAAVDVGVVLWPMEWSGSVELDHTRRGKPSGHQVSLKVKGRAGKEGKKKIPFNK